MNWRTSDLRPHPWSVAIYGDTAPDAAFLQSIQERGILMPLRVKADGTIISGHLRWAAAKQLGLETVPVELVEPGSDLEERQTILDFNRQRNKTFSQRMREGEALEAIEKERAKARQGTRTDLGRNIPQIFGGCSRGEVIDIVAAAVGLGSGETYRKAKAVWTAARAGDPKAVGLVEKLDRGETTISRALADLRREEKLRLVRQKIATIEGIQIDELAGEYDVIVIDPPWPMVAPESVGFDYPTMTEEELAAMKMPAAQDCHLWLWTISSFLPMAFRLLEVWGFQYKSTFVWHKPGGFQPSGLPRYNCEFALYAQRGEPFFINTIAFRMCFEAPRGKHSEKPEEFYEMVRRVTTGKRIDIFNRRPIRGFDTWGKEAAWTRPSTYSVLDDADYHHYVYPFLAGFSPHACAGNLYLCPNWAWVSGSLPGASLRPKWQAERQAVLAQLGVGPGREEDEIPEARGSFGLG